MAEKSPKLVLVIRDAVMGHGDDALGGILIRSFFHTIMEIDPTPDTVIFYNGGVKLVVDGSPVLEDLQNLADKGVQLLACGTCLGHFDLKEKIKVGQISNMYDISETLLTANKVVNL